MFGFITFVQITTVRIHIDRPILHAIAKEKANLIDIVTSIMMYKFTNLSQLEIRAMLGLNLEELSETLLGFTNLSDLEHWLAEHR
ncbi:DUF4351 domain-containing protein [Leptolyngbya sp. FACHB-17]|uniref:DUF4351 domain-containing protein n=1 Tax=unclassified Leptolyngbya TaxID=2650499 RepID=UPI001F55532A|nr:DUF4351 domain-containing protein [Leptolyngbya sp. FACHB-17]